MSKEDKKPKFDGPSVTTTNDKGEKITIKTEATPPAEPKPDTNMVEVSTDDLKALIRRIDDLETSNERLLGAADKSRLAHVDSKKQGGKLIRTVRISRLGKNGPIIMGWKLKVNESYIENGRWREHQVVDVTLEDGKTKEMQLLDFYRMQNKDLSGEIIAEKVSTNKETGEDEQSITVEFKDGKTLEIGLAFIN